MAERGPVSVQARWEDLIAKDAGKVARALLALCATPTEAVAFIQQLPTNAKKDEPAVLAIIGDLASPSFEKRTQAMKELEKLGAVAEPILRRQLDRVDLEVRLRMQRLLERYEAETTIQRRVVLLLDHIGTAEARALVEAFPQRNAGSR
jgi:hypothetical protein